MGMLKKRSTRWKRRRKKKQEARRAELKENEKRIEKRTQELVDITMDPAKILDL